MITPWVRKRRGYRSDLSDERWALIEPVLAAWRAARVGLGISRPVHDLREIVNAIRRLVRDYETLPQRTRAMIHWAMSNTMSRYLTGESAPTWRNETT